MLAVRVEVQDDRLESGLSVRRREDLQVPTGQHLANHRVLLISGKWRRLSGDQAPVIEEILSILERR